VQVALGLLQAQSMMDYIANVLCMIPDAKVRSPRPLAQRSPRRCFRLNASTSLLAVITEGIHTGSPSQELVRFFPMGRSPFHRLL